MTSAAMKVMMNMLFFCTKTMRPSLVECDVIWPHKSSVLGMIQPVTAEIAKVLTLSPQQWAKFEDDESLSEKSLETSECNSIDCDSIALHW